MARQHDRKIILEDGLVFTGIGFGSRRESVCEIVFNTSMVGYQEIISDPSYTYQMVTMTYPLIGNYGITDEDFETRTPTIGGLIVREYNDLPSNFRYTRTLSEIMEENDIPGISDVDTRQITRSIRDKGSRKVLITDIDTPMERCMEIIRNTEIPTDAVSKVSCKKIWYSKTFKHKFNVVAVDCGIKLNIIRSLNRKGCNVTVVPYNTTAEQIEAIHPDGVFFSNGPGDPENVPEVVELIKELRGRYPIFGICLGHQLISLSYGARTYKLKFGHRGGNHPVMNLKTGKIEITSQNHSYAVDDSSVANTGLAITHMNLLDNTVEGVSCERDNIFSVQYHPESAPGPQDSTYLFDQFIHNMEVWKNAKKN
ncbi:MAG: glutamine-hydrolyzing carbamoyl-phosphate synthase small subunit [Clostridia bacterium]|nr:glutamine-hydrolyzing carbamoyl-phosphate synthase small subunit [Clostridia bacterium]